jgi:hypothetical protein
MDDTILNIAYVIFVALSFLHGYFTGREQGITLGANQLYDILLADGRKTKDGKVVVKLTYDE